MCCAAYIGCVESSLRRVGEAQLVLGQLPERSTDAGLNVTATTAAAVCLQRRDSVREQAHNTERLFVYISNVDTHI